LPSAIVLAAGASKRFPGTKQLAVMGGMTLVERAIDAVPPREVGEIVVVLGHQARAVERVVRAKRGVKVAVNKRYRAGMATSIRVGIGAVASGSTGAILLLADQPFVTLSLLQRMLRVFQAGGPGGRIVAAAHADLVTPPVIFSREYFEELAELRGDEGARSVIERHADALALVRVRSKAVLADIDTLEDFDKARKATRASRTPGEGAPLRSRPW